MSGAFRGHYFFLLIAPHLSLATRERIHASPPPASRPMRFSPRPEGNSLSGLIVIVIYDRDTSWIVRVRPD